MDGLQKAISAAREALARAQAARSNGSPYVPIACADALIPFADLLAALECAEPAVIDAEGNLLQFAADGIQGMSVSIDLGLPGQHGAEHRFFGTVTEVMNYPASKNGVILLIQDPEPNERIDVDVVARAIANDTRAREGNPPVPDTFPVDRLENPEHYRSAAKAAIKALGLEC